MHLFEDCSLWRNICVRFLIVQYLYNAFNPHLRGPWVHIGYSIPEYKNVLKNLWQHYCFINLKTYVKRQYFGLGLQIVSLFLYIGTYMAFKTVSIIQSHGHVNEGFKWKSLFILFSISQKYLFGGLLSLTVILFWQQSIWRSAQCRAYSGMRSV